MNKELNGRSFLYDVLRVIAISAVVMIHTSARLVTDFNPGTIQFFVGNIFDSISRFGVPIFVMLSGTLMLDEKRDEADSKIMRKIFKLFLLLIVWSGFYALMYNMDDFWNTFEYSHLWYLYMIIGLYLITPVLRLFVTKENKKYIYYMILLSLVFQFVPGYLDLYGSISKVTNMFSVNFVCGFIPYYLLGWLIVQDYQNFSKYSPILYSFWEGALYA